MIDCVRQQTALVAVRRPPGRIQTIQPGKRVRKWKQTTHTFEYELARRDLHQIDWTYRHQVERETAGSMSAVSDYSS